MHKFFVPIENVHEKHINISGDDVNHISKVLRLRCGEEIGISNAKGQEYICSIREISKNDVLCDIIEEFKNTTESPIEIVLYQGFPKAQKMDFIIQKCVEIGVSKIQPVITKRVIVKSNDNTLLTKNDRWNRIALEAAKQSNRGIVPEVMAPISFDKAIEELKYKDIAVVPYEKQLNDGFKSILKNKNNVKTAGILIGPEGGFEEEEINECLQNGIYPITLGPRILRTETAGFVAASIILYEIGDMGGVK